MSASLADLRRYGMYAWQTVALRGFGLDLRLYWHPSRAARAQQAHMYAVYWRSRFLVISLSRFLVISFLDISLSRHVTYEYGVVDSGPVVALLRRSESES